jgi:hypothetical protein
LIRCRGRKGPAVAGTASFGAAGVAAASFLVSAVAPADAATPVVAVSVRAAACVVAKSDLVEGPYVFRVVNRSGQQATFTVGRRTIEVQPGGSGRLGVTLRPGSARYACRVGVRRVAAGRIRIHPAVSEHRVGVRVAGGVGEFFDRLSGARFVPRGSNYIRLAPQVDTFGRTQVYHATFIVGQYDAERAERELKRMAADGYNVVRVFLNTTCAQGCSTNTTTGEISRAYVANLVDFLRRARSHGVFVLLTAEWLPAGAIYDSIGGSVRRDWFDNVNIVFLSPEGVAMSARFWRDLISELIRRRAPLDAVFAYSLWNEAVVEASFAPFTLSSGTVTTANGQTYDMASSADRKRMIDESFVYYVDRVRAAIQATDPTALVTMGFFHDTEPNPARRGDTRLVRTRAVIERSTADFVDIHPYPDDELTFPQFMQNYGIDGPTAKPIIMGEFGGSRRVYVSASQAAQALVSWQRQSCAYGIDGWLLWTWDTDEAPNLWNALSGGGVIEQALAPRNRPDPCA